MITLVPCKNQNTFLRYNQVYSLALELSHLPFRKWCLQILIVTYKHINDITIIHGIIKTSTKGMVNDWNNQNNAIAMDSTSFLENIVLLIFQIYWFRNKEPKIHGPPTCLRQKITTNYPRISALISNISMLPNSLYNSVYT